MLNQSQADHAATYFFASVGPQHLSPDELAAFYSFSKRARTRQTREDRKKAQ